MKSVVTDKFIASRRIEEGDGANVDDAIGGR